MSKLQWTGTGATVEKAVEKGLKKLGLTREQVEIKVLGEKTSGLFSLFGFRRMEVTLVEKPGARRFQDRDDRYDRDSRRDNFRGDRGGRDRGRGSDDRGGRRDEPRRDGGRGRDDRGTAPRNDRGPRGDDRFRNDRPQEGRGAPRSDDRSRNDQPRDDRGPRDDRPRRDDVRNDRGPRRDEPRRDEPRRDESRRDEPRRDEPRRDEPRRDEPRRDDFRGRDRGPSGPRRDDRRPDDRSFNNRPRRDDAPRDSSAPREDAPQRPVTEVPSAEVLLTQWKSLLDDDISWTPKNGESGDVVLILTAESGEKLGNELVESLQHLLNVVRAKSDRSAPRVFLEIEGQAVMDEQQIIEEARRAADEVKRTGQSFRMNPMDSRDRRLVHQTLADHPDVETASEGEGQWRKVVVRLKTRDRE